jgi:STE24 endopeptidase
MQLAILTAVLAALAAGESGSGPVAGVAWRLAVVALATLVAPLAAMVGTQRLAPAVAADADTDDAIARLHAVVIVLWLGAVAAVLFVVQWPLVVRGNWGLAAWPLVDELVILLPVVTPLLLVWAALYRLDRAAQAAAFRARNMELPPARPWSYVWLHVRQHLGLILLPPLAIVGVFEALSTGGIAAGDANTAWWLVVPMLGTMLVLMPLAVRRIWRTTPLAAGPLRDALRALCVARNCHVREMLVWHTDGTMANAAVVGVSRWLRYMLLTDLLIKRLSAPEIAAVVRHELAHLRRWHLPLRLALLLLPLVWWLAIKQAWPEVEHVVPGVLETLGINAKQATALGLPVAMLIYAVVVLGWYSRLLEHDADLDACLTADGRFDAQTASTFCQALITLCGKSSESRFAEWLHPSFRRRLLVIQNAAADATFPARFRRRLRWLAAAIAAAYVTAGLLAIA